MLKRLAHGSVTRLSLSKMEPSMVHLDLVDLLWTTTWYASRLMSAQVPHMQDLQVLDPDSREYSSAWCFSGSSGQSRIPYREVTWRIRQ